MDVTWKTRLFVALQQGLPQHWLSNRVFALTRWRGAPLSRWLMQAFVRRFALDLSEAELTTVNDYPHLNALFTRALRADARPIDPRPDAVLSPVDGRVSQIGTISNGQLLQAKGQQFQLDELLGGAEDLAAQFADGQFATLYLSPHDYHRIHMPLTGELRTVIEVPGRLFSVNPATVATRPRLFARNERVICHFTTESGPLVLVLVGALLVGSIETVWAGRITPPRLRQIRRTDYKDDAPLLKRGDEMGRFNMGSTVIVLLPANSAQWLKTLSSGSAVTARSAIALLPDIQSAITPQ